MTFTPKPHQLEAIERLVALNGNALLCDDMGLGKSAVALWTMQRLKVERIIVVCPETIGAKWCDEVRQTLGIEAALLRTRKHVEQLVTSPRVVVLHYDLLARLTDLAPLVAPRTGLILDEAHYIKNRLSGRSGAAARLAALCAHRLCLTGTLVRNDVRDVWHPTNIALPGYLESYARFEARYCNFRQLRLKGRARPIRDFIRGKNEGWLRAKLAEVMVRRRKEEVLTLPPLERQVVPIELDDESREAYDDMRRMAMAEIEAQYLAGLPMQVSLEDFDLQHLECEQSVVMRARSVLEQTIRLEQIAMGLVRTEGDRGDWLRGNSKLRWIVDTVVELRQQHRAVAVFCKFNLMIDALAKELAAEGVADLYIVHGAISASDRAERIQHFHNDGGVFLCQVKVAEGFDLTRCSDAIFVGTDWVPAVTEQAEARLHRMGQQGSVTCFYPVATKTVDEHLHKVVVQKAMDASRLDPAEVRQWLES